MSYGPEIQKKGLVLYFVCPTCRNIEPWDPSSLKAGGVPCCQSAEEDPDYHYEEMDYYGFIVVNNKESS